MTHSFPTRRSSDLLMGWISSGDTLNQVRLLFATREEAIAYAERRGLDYTVEPEQVRRVIPSNYVDNFKPRRSEEHTTELQSLIRISYAVFCLKQNIYDVRLEKHKSETIHYK